MEGQCTTSVPFIERYFELFVFREEELLHTNVFDGSLVVLIDGLHHQLDKYGRFVAEFLGIDVRTIRNEGGDILIKFLCLRFS